VAVSTETLATSRETDYVETIGTLKAAREATIAGKVMGTVTEIRKRAGDPVREGEILVVIDSRDVAGQVAQAEGALAQAKAAATLAETNFRRFQQLHERGAASALELDQARYQYDTALGAVKQAEGAVATASSYESYARIPAPFSGRVVDRRCEEGDLAQPGRPILEIEDTRHLRLFASLEASRAPAATVGKSVEVRVPERGDGVFAGTIREVTPAADPATRSVLVKIDLAETPSLAAGLFARARIPSGERDVLRVPASAVVRRGSLTGVFVDVEGRAAFRMVTLAGDGGDRPEVLAGLSAGDVVVLSPPPALTIGARLEARS
jgi:RND family efflux transporter MFP subunit